MLEISKKAIDLNRVYFALNKENCGANLIFLGTVRNLNEGKSVEAVSYECFEPLAQKVFKELELEVREKFSKDLNVVIIHRIGQLQVGEVSTVIGVSSPHREQSYQASRYIIEELKLRVPIWKEEHYLDGESVWLEGNRL